MPTKSDKTLAAIHALAPAPRVYPSSHAMEDCCAICAEPLTHVAYGPCGHKDACVECVARLRFVLDDRRCVICQVSCERVFATRHMGEYTETIGADGFEALPKKARAGQLHHDEKLDMFFDDDAVCGKVKALRSLVCGECVRDAGGDAGVVTQHSSVKALKAHMREKHGKFFCEVCLEGRKVFLSEQVRVRAFEGRLAGGRESRVAAVRAHELLVWARCAVVRLALLTGQLG